MQGKYHDDGVSFLSLWDAARFITRDAWERSIPANSNPWHMAKRNTGGPKLNLGRAFATLTSFTLAERNGNKGKEIKANN